MLTSSVLTMLLYSCFFGTSKVAHDALCFAAIGGHVGAVDALLSQTVASIDVNKPCALWPGVTVRQKQNTLIITVHTCILAHTHTHTQAAFRHS